MVVFKTWLLWVITPCRLYLRRACHFHFEVPPTELQGNNSEDQNLSLSFFLVCIYNMYNIVCVSIPMHAVQITAVITGSIIITVNEFE